MKKIMFTITLVLFCCASGWSTYFQFTEGDFLYNVTLTDGEEPVVICYYNGEAVDEVAFPDTVIYDYPYVYDNKLYYHKYTLCVTGVGGLSKCAGSLTKVRLPAHVRTINYRAFDGCTALAEITLPASVREIGKLAFNGCNDLSVINFSDSLTKIGEEAFKNCVSLTTLKLPDNLSTIGKGAFSKCTRLEEVHLPKGLTNIHGNAFEDCCRLAKITVDSLCVVYDSRNNCNAVMERKTNKLVTGCKTTIVPEGATAIGSLAFSGNRCSDSVDLPATVTVIGDSAFRLSNLQHISLPEGLLSIGLDAFLGSGLKSVALPVSLKTIKTEAFRASALTEVYVPEGAQLTSIYPGAFEYCRKLKSFVVPAKVGYIGNDAFADCDALATVTFETGGTNTLSIGYSSFERSGLKSIELPGNVKILSVAGSTATNGTFRDCVHLESVTLAEGITDIPDFTFYNCSSLKKISFPKSLKTIGELAFDGCVSLDSIGFYDQGITLGMSAFRNCTGLTALILPNNGYTAQGVFSGCTGLKRIYNYRKIPLVINGYTFNGLYKSDCDLYVPIESVEDYKAADIWCQFNIIGMDTGGIGDVASDTTSEATPVGYYDVQGRRMSGPQRGLNIVRYSNGTSRKVIVR